MKNLPHRAICAILLCAAIGGCTFIRIADLRKSRPLTLSLDVAPGYGNAIYLDATDGPIDLLVQRVKSSPTKKWAPTFFIAYYSEKATSYYLYLAADPRSNKIYAQTRLIDEKSQDVLVTRNYPHAYSLNHKFKVRAVLTGKLVALYLDGQFVGSQELICEPKFIELGASSGTFNIRLISPPPPAAPD